MLSERSLNQRDDKIGIIYFTLEMHAHFNKVQDKDKKQKNNNYTKSIESYYLWNHF